MSVILSPADAARLLTLAEKATPGPWTYRPSGWDHPLESACVLASPDGVKVRYVHFDNAANLEYIAAASPDVVLALLAALEQQQGRHTKALALAEIHMQPRDVELMAALLRGEGA